MKYVRLLALILALSLSLSWLTACGSDVGESSADASAVESSDAEPQAPAAEPDTGIPAEALEDVVAYLTDGVYTKDTVVATVGDAELTAAQVLYWAAYQQYNMSYYYYYYYGVAMDTSVDMGDGTTLGDQLISDAMTTALAYAVGNQKANELGVALSEENATAVEDLYQSNVEYYGEYRWEDYVAAGLIDEADYTDEQKAAWIQEEGENYFVHSLLYFACHPDSYADVAEDYYYYFSLQDQLFGEGGEYEPTEATMADYLNSYIEDNGVCWARCILFSTQKAEDDEAVAAVKEQADAAYAELSALTGEELSERFTELQSEYDTSGYTAGEVQYYTNSDSLVDGYYDGIQALSVGEIGMTDLTDYGYFILLREADQTEDIYDAVESNYIMDTFDALILQWTDEYGVDYSRDFSDLDATAFFTKLAELQTAVTAADELPEAETEDTADAEDADAADDTAGDGTTDAE